MKSFLKTIINSLQSWTKKELRNVGADWNQNDSNKPGYVKNRPFFEENGKVHKIDKKFLDIPDNVATKEDVQALEDKQYDADIVFEIVNAPSLSNLSGNVKLPINTYRKVKDMLDSGKCPTAILHGNFDAGSSKVNVLFVRSTQFTTVASNSNSGFTVSFFVNNDGSSDCYKGKITVISSGMSGPATFSKI